MAVSERTPWQPLRNLIEADVTEYEISRIGPRISAESRRTARLIIAGHMVAAIRTVDTFLCDLTTGAIDHGFTSSPE